MAVSEAQKRAIKKYKATDKGRESIKESKRKYQQNVKRISFDFSIISEPEITNVIEQLPIPKGQYGKQAFIEKLKADGYL